MPDEILVNVTLNEVRVALIVDGKIREIQVERQNQRGITGNIYCGRVRRILPGLNAAFIDMGFGRPGFLHARDMQNGESSLDEAERNRALLKLHPGDRLVVQVTKDPLGTKGPRLTTCFSLPGRLLVLTPDVFRMAVSNKVTDGDDAQRLLGCIQPGRFGGYIFRTLAAQSTRDACVSEQQLLDVEWEQVIRKMVTAKPGDCLHQAPCLARRVLRDLAGVDSVSRIQVDDHVTMCLMKEYALVWCPMMVDSIELYDGDFLLFEKSGAEKMLNQALQRRVSLKSGGHVVFDQTEAMTTIDVNTGSALSAQRAGDVVFRTNLEAVEVIAHQVRLRNLGGIIIIDFIDMADITQRENILEAIIEAFANDTAHTEFSELTRLGLVQMTRKRARESLMNTLCEPCPVCQQRSKIRSAETVAHDVYRALQQMHSKSWGGFRVQVSPDVAGYFLEHEPEALSVLENTLGRTIEVCADVRYGREAWDILPIPGTQV